MQTVPQNKKLEELSIGQQMSLKAKINAQEKYLQKSYWIIVEQQSTKTLNKPS